MNTFRTRAIHSPARYSQYPTRPQRTQSSTSRWAISPWFVICLLLTGFILFRQFGGALAGKDPIESVQIQAPLSAQDERLDQKQNQSAEQHRVEQTPPAQDERLNQKLNQASNQAQTPAPTPAQTPAQTQAQTQARSTALNVSRAFLERIGGGDAWRTPDGLTILNRPGEGLRVLSVDPQTGNILWFAWDRDLDGWVDAAANLAGCYPAKQVPCESDAFRGPGNPGAERFKFWQDRFEKAVDSVK